MHALRFFIDKKITAKGGGDHVRTIDVPIADELIEQATRLNEKLLIPPGEVGVQHDPAAAEHERAKRIVERQLKRGEVIGSVASITTDEPLPAPLSLP